MSSKLKEVALRVKRVTYSPDGERDEGYTHCLALATREDIKVLFPDRTTYVKCRIRIKNRGGDFRCANAILEERLNEILNH